MVLSSALFPLETLQKEPRCSFERRWCKSKCTLASFSAFSAVHTFKTCDPLLGHQEAESRELTSNKMDGSKVVSVRCILPRFPLHSQPFQLAHPLPHRPPSISYSSRLATPLHPNLIKGGTWRITLSYLDLTSIHSPPSLLPLGRSFARETRIPYDSRKPKISL